MIHEGHEDHEDRILKANTVAGAVLFSLRVLRVLRGSEYPTGALGDVPGEIQSRFSGPVSIRRIERLIEAA